MKSYAEAKWNLDSRYHMQGWEKIHNEGAGRGPYSYIPLLQH